MIGVSEEFTTSKSSGESTSTDVRKTARTQDRGAMQPDIIDLPFLNLAEIRRPFEIKTSTIRMVQHSPFTGKKIRTFTSKCSFNYVKHSTWTG
jgi:hypothetical protein